jgi:superfamily II DNA/RNA helicase
VRIIIFTEYRATQKWLFDLLAREGLAAEGRLEMIYGGMPNDQRERIKAAFQAHPKESVVRILLATDAASEGVNLQNHCSRLIHFEIPWNPNRMEQRNGRVDRHGQKANEVAIFHFVGNGFDTAGAATKVGDLEADLEFLMRAALKIETSHTRLGKTKITNFTLLRPLRTVRTQTSRLIPGSSQKSVITPHLLRAGRSLRGARRRRQTRDKVFPCQSDNTPLERRGPAHAQGHGACEGRQ